MADPLVNLLPTRVDAARHVIVGRAGQPDAAISHFVMHRGGHGPTTPNAPGDAYMAVVYLRALGARDMWSDGRHEVIRAVAAGALAILDLRRSFIVDLREPFQTVNFQIPRWMFVDLTDELGKPTVDALDRQGVVDRDETMAHLASALLPALSEPCSSRLFLDHLFGTVALHLLARYGEVTGRARRSTGGLAPWQERRAKELLIANLGADITLAELAGTCHLTPAYFSRAFRRTTGRAPYRWLTEQKITRAKHLLVLGEVPLAEIAARCGFADQSHFTRVFAKITGLSPGRWRRIHKR
jgi:AraC family transcriptional regulator